MKKLMFCFISGAVLLYFVNIALLKTAIPNLEWTIHAGIRFLVGFFVLGVSYFYAKAFGFIRALQLTFFIVILDYIYDYFVDSYRLNFEIILHGIYVLIWGAFMGYLTARQMKGD